MKKKSPSSHLVAVAATCAIAAGLAAVAIVAYAVVGSDDFVTALRVLGILAAIITYSILIASRRADAQNTVAFGIFFTISVALATANMVFAICACGAVFALAGIVHLILKAVPKKGERRLRMSLP